MRSRDLYCAVCGESCLLAARFRAKARLRSSEKVVFAACNPADTDQRQLVAVASARQTVSIFAAPNSAMHSVR